MKLCMILCLSILIGALYAPFGGADAAGDDPSTVQDETCYCYGDHPTCVPFTPGGEWEVTAEDGTVLDHVLLDKDTGAIGFDITGVEGVVTVRQTVGSEVAVTRLIPMHAVSDTSDPDRKYTVDYHDGDRIVHSQEFAEHTYVREGSPFLHPPDLQPEEGKVFGGWFTDTEFKNRLDRYEPVTHDMDVYAKWSDPNPQTRYTIIVEEVTIAETRTNAVVFDPVYGLRYDVTDVRGDSLDFTVSPVRGYVFSGIEVTSDHGTVASRGDGRYTLSGIDQDILVSIGGDALHTLDYAMHHARISVGGSAPDRMVSGPFEAVVSPAFGWTGVHMKVYMDGEDVTGECVHGNRISIGDVDGNLVIDAEASIPWLLIVVIVVIVAVAAVLEYRRTRRRPPSGRTI